MGKNKKIKKNNGRVAKKKQNSSGADVVKMKQTGSKQQNQSKNTKNQGKKSKLSKLQEKFKTKLDSGKFRWLNEELYTNTSDHAFDLFQKNQSLFTVYHKGFASQVEKWPENPVDVIIDEVRKHKGWEIADFGCGDARIARTLHKQNKIHSFDLVKPNEFVTVANSANVPLENEQVDAAVFCLSLMGVDYARFLVEANRVLKPKGILYVAEVKSRFANPNHIKANSGNDEVPASAKAMKTGIKKFIKDLVPLGFDLLSSDASNQMFALFKFRKSGRDVQYEGHDESQDNALKACKYKKR